MDSPLILPAGVHCVFESGARLKPASGIAVTISGTFDAGNFQVFDISAGGTVVLSAHHEFNPLWWGAVGDGRTDDTAALQALAIVFDTPLAQKMLTIVARIGEPSAMRTVAFMPTWIVSPAPIRAAIRCGQ